MYCDVQHRLLDPDSVWSPIFTALAHACLEEVSVSLCGAILFAQCVVCCQHADTIRYSHAALARIADQNMFARNLSLTDAGPTQFVDITTPFFGDHECGRHDQYPLPSMLEAELLCQFLIMRSSALTGHFTATAAAQKAIKETAPSIAFVADVAFAGYLFDGVRLTCSADLYSVVAVV